MNATVRTAARYRLAIFDFDGTLADSADWAFDAINELADRHRFRRMLADDRERLRGRSARELMRELGVSSWRLPWIVRDFRRLAARDFAEIRPFAWVGEMFDALARLEVAIAIVSSNSADNIRCVLGPALSARVTHINGGASLFGKANKIRASMRHGGSTPKDTVAVGDEIRDIEAARAVGVDSVAVAWGYATTTALANAQPTCLARDPMELIQLMQR